MGEKQQLWELHDTYVWEVNAAVGEGRLDLVWGLADEYLDKALQLMTGGEPTGCGREDCAVCERPRPGPTGPRRPAFRLRFPGAAARRRRTGR